MPVLKLPWPDSKLLPKSDVPGRKCPDYDDDCKTVKNHAKCAAGTVVALSGDLYVLPPIDGFCPYVCGMEGRK